MKNLFILSYYSALHSSIENNEWNPSGMPAIVRLFEGLKKNNISFDAIFRNQRNNDCVKKEYKNDFFNNSMTVWGICNVNKIGYIIRKISFIIFCIKTANRGKYDLIYCDRANVTIGAILKFLGKKVVLRVHGVTQMSEKFGDFKYRIKHLDKFLSYKANFDSMIFSQDGTPVEYFAEKFTKKAVKKEFLLNGVDINAEKDKLIRKAKDKLQINNSYVTILFVGRFSSDKGINEFVNVTVKLSQKGLLFNTIIIGNGLLADDINNKIKNNGLSNVKILSDIPHSEILYYYKVSDIYVSLNKLGGLSNTVLEAVKTENCIVTLKKNDKTFRDVSTYNFFEDSAVYINRNSIEKDLFCKLKYLIENPKQVDLHKNKISEKSSKLISWDERVEKEIDLFKGIVNG